MVAPLLLLLVFGTIEYGFMYRDSLTVANGARAGARVGASAGSDPLADYQILAAVAGATGSLDGVNKVVVFKASSADGGVPSACSASDVGVAGLCNVYSTSDLALPQASFADAGYTKDDYWSATTRVTSLSSQNGPDYIGVWVSARHTHLVTSLFGDKTLTDTVIMRLEPTL